MPGKDGVTKSILNKPKQCTFQQHPRLVWENPELSLPVLFPKKCSGNSMLGLQHIPQQHLSSFCQIRHPLSSIPAVTAHMLIDQRYVTTQRRTFKSVLNKPRQCIALCSSTPIMVFFLSLYEEIKSFVLLICFQKEMPSQF